MEMLAAGIALWALGSLLLALVWMAAAQASARRTALFRPSVFLPTPRTEYVDLTDSADVEAAAPSLPLPQPAQ